MPDKLIVTNLTALRAKYGTEFKAVGAALKDLVSADAKRGLKTIVVSIDDPQDVTPAVKDAKDAEQAKKAIDSLYKKHGPDYLVILGATDVIPHVKLRNPVYSPGDDDDRYVPSDLPYACEHAYSMMISDFLGPTRVVGRLPDIEGAESPEFLIGLLKTAAAWKERAAADYSKYFGITADVWKGSTGMSLRKIFDTDADLKRIPPEGEKWPPALLKRLTHFINCHGADVDSKFYGQRGDDFPVSMNAAYLTGKVTEGTVAAAECCYGGQLYDPKKTGDQMGICTTYLSGQAYGYLGSTTIAYGPANGNGSADLICQFFLRSVLAGASTGRAALEARQKFIGGSGETSPTDLKTIAQFILLGDPSIQPIKGAAPHAMNAKSLVAARSTKLARAERRRGLFLRGTTLGETQAFSASKSMKTNPGITKQMTFLARQSGIKPKKMLSFEIRKPAGAKALMKGMPKAFQAKTAEVVRYHVVFGTHRKKGRQDVDLGVAIVAKSADGEIVQAQELYLKM